jgi:P27 family predicted phage terminase small subunit
MTARTADDAGQAPAHLSPETKAWWERVLQEYQLEPHHLRLLQLAAESWDRGQVARRELEEHGGVTFRDQAGNIRSHPATAIQRDSAVLFARVMRELDLDGGGAPEAPRAAALPSNRR